MGGAAGKRALPVLIINSRMATAQLTWRNDLVVSRQGSAEEAAFVVKDPISGRFFRLRENEHFIAQQLDGNTSFDELSRRVEEKFGQAISKETLERFVERLRGLGLLADERTTTPPRPQRRIAGDLFYLRLKAFDPNRLFSWLIGPVQFLFTPLFVASSAALIVFALGLTVANWPEISREFLGLFQFESLLLAWIVALAVITLHEFAHGLTCKHFGGHVRELGFLLLYFQPAFYCNVSDAWLFPEKSKRLWVTFAGAYFELFLWALATLVWRLTDTDTTINHLALVVVATSAVKSLFNLNPLIKLDGYYLLSDWLDIPNLRRKAFDYLGSAFRRLFGGSPEGRAPGSARERRIYLIYGLLAIGYTYWILTWVAARVGNFLVTRYEGWGFVLFAALLTALFRNPIRRSFSHLRAAAASNEGKLRLVKRLAKVLLLLGGLGAALYFWRMELKVSGEFTIRPIRNADTRAEVEGIIAEIPHDEGEVVAKGAVIARLADRDVRAELRQVAAELEEKAARLRMLKAGPRAEEVELAKTLVAKAEERIKYARVLLEMHQALVEERLISKAEFEETKESVSVRGKELQEANDRLKVLLAGSRPEEIEALDAEIHRLNAQQRYLQEQLNLLTVTSPVAGVITTRKLKEKLGQLVKKGDLVAEVHELNTVTAEIAISEKDISEVRLGQPVILKARAHPQISFSGVVTAIAPIATPPEDWRQPRTVLVITQLDNSSLLLRPAMSGRAKIYCGQQRAFDLLLRRLTRYLRVEFWSWW